MFEIGSCWRPVLLAAMVASALLAPRGALAGGVDALRSPGGAVSQSETAMGAGAGGDAVEPGAAEPGSGPGPEDLLTPQPAVPEADSRTVLRGANWSLRLTGELTNYVLYNSHPFFGNPDRTWVETTWRFGAIGQWRNVRVGIVGLGIKTFSRDPYGTGTEPAGSPPGTPDRSSSPAFDLDQFWLEVTGIGGLPLKATVGRQFITVGTYFLIGDGIYDGFSAATQQGVYQNTRRSFDAVRLELDLEPLRVDAFVYRVNPTWTGDGTKDSVLGGVDVSRDFEAIRGRYAASLYYRHNGSRLDNENAILDVRGEQRVPLGLGDDDPYLGGEWVWQLAGVCRNPLYCAQPLQSMDEHAFHVEAGWRGTHPLQPFLEVGYVYYSSSFTPIATGFYEWGKWYLGNQIDWILFGTNSKVFRASAGFWPTDQARLQLLYFNTRQVSPTGTSTGGDLANELMLVAEWYPTEWFWANVLIAYSMPGGALGRSGLVNPFSFINQGATPIGADRSFDTVVAMGVRF